jgi:hypothetical protein
VLYHHRGELAARQPDSPNRAVGAPTDSSPSVSGSPKVAETASAVEL